MCIQLWKPQRSSHNLKEEYPKTHIIIAGDDDHKTEGNPGRTKATEAASSIDTSVVFPDFGENRP